MTAKEKTLKVKSAPNSKESEMMVLGCMLTSINSLNIAADGLEDSDFFFKEHKTIFSSLKEAYHKDQPADIHIIAEFLKRDGKLEEAGGIAYLTTLAQYAGTSAYIDEYVKLVKDKAVLRQMIFTAQEIEKESLAGPQDVSELLDEAQAKFFQISQATSTDQSIPIKDLLSGAKSETKLPYLKELQARQEEYQIKGPNKSYVTGIPTHFADLDKLINGLNHSNLIILASRPAMGKSALALNIAENVCFRDRQPVGIFSLEMSAEELLHRIICSQSEVESEKIKTGALNGSDYQRIVASVNEMQKHSMIIDDQPGIKITDLRARARRMKEAYDIQFLVIDYLQLLSGSGTMRSIENRQNEISEISRLLKNLARELNIPVLCLSQLSRKVEERQGHRPMMSDLRESGCVTGETKIKDAETGKMYSIKELAERKQQTPITVYAIDKNLKIGKHKLIKAFYSGKKEVFELKTRGGLSIKASANHPFLQSDGWTRLDQLKSGDMIGRPKPLSSHDDDLLDLTESNVYWDDILSITKLKIEDVYDATVDGVHNFIANDIIIHNSIEQDSDIVMFLLRREYYDPYDKPGQAELIVAKNRHGGVGSVYLTFRKELAQFANFTPANLKANEEAFAAFSPTD